jgi:hypothetical protein
MVLTQLEEQAIDAGKAYEIAKAQNALPSVLNRLYQKYQDLADAAYMEKFRLNGMGPND